MYLHDVLLKIKWGSYMGRKVKRVTVYLFGGLGNQLFQYFAGMATAEAMGAKLYLKPFGQTSAVGREGEVGIAAFKTVGITTSSRIPQGLQEKLLRRFVTLISQFRLGGFSRHYGIFLSDVSELPDIKMDCPRHIRLMGYFQNFKFLDFLERQKKLTTLSLVNPTPWFANLEEQARKSIPIIVHIRRGDYLNHAETIGVLDLIYFKNALELIPRDENSEFWIFSDSIDIAKDFTLFAQLPVLRTRIIQAPSDSPDAESMLLMTLGSALIISNSTFSWWGAYLNKNAKMIIAPKKWFKNLDDPPNLVPVNWIYCESVWQV
jgi:hypothetical protein